MIKTEGFTKGMKALMLRKMERMVLISLNRKI
jgi:hypothetical protein